MSDNTSPAAADINNEGTHLLLASTSTASFSSNRSTKEHARWILLSTTASRFGSRTWEFATPLLLLEWSPGSLAAPAALGLTCAIFRLIVSPMLGRLADGKWNRMTTVWVGASMQAAGCLISVGALYFWNTFAASQMSRIASLAIVILAGVIETLGAQLSSVAVKKEWVPIVFEEADNITVTQQEEALIERRKKHLFHLTLPDHVTLSFMNTTMTNIDLMSAMFGPVLAGYVLEVLSGTDGSLQRGFAVIALINAMSFVPELILLRRVYLSCPQLQQKHQTAPKTSSNTNDTSINVDKSPWLIWYSHPSGLPLLTVSLASLYLTALSPAGVVLTAYLVSTGLSPTALGVFRGAGALSGVLGVTLFSLFRKCEAEHPSMSNEDTHFVSVSIERLRCVSLAFLMLEVAAVLVAAVAYSFCNAIYISDTPESSTVESGTRLMPWPMFVFLSAIVISRAGLYSFDVGVLEIEQYIVDERYRNAVGSVEGALCSLAEMGMYVMSIILPNPDLFVWQVGISATAVGFGGASFGLFLCVYHMHGHSHHDESCDGHNHNHGHSHHDHAHTLQQERELKDGYHIHLHRHMPYQRFIWN